jgi:hypothetical protein
MLTIVNNLTFHLVIPGAGDKGRALKLPPNGSVQVEKVTGPLKDAERNELVVINYPKAETKPASPPPKKKNGRRKKKR